MPGLNAWVVATVNLPALIGAFGVVALAAPEGREALDVTIALLSKNAEGPEEITRRIELPDVRGLDRRLREQKNAPGAPDLLREHAREERENAAAHAREPSDGARGERDHAGPRKEKGTDDNPLPEEPDVAAQREPSSEPLPVTPDRGPASAARP